MHDQVIAMYCFLDDACHALHLAHDPRRQTSDAEILTVWITAALHFGGNWTKASAYFRSHGLMPNLVGMSRFSRRLHRLKDLAASLFHHLGSIFKSINTTATYLLDSFPLELCALCRMQRVKLLKHKKMLGRHSSQRRWLYGVRVHVLMTEAGQRVEFALLSASFGETIGLAMLPMDLPPGSRIVADGGYVSLEAKEWLWRQQHIWLDPVYKKDMRRRDSPKRLKEKTLQRKRIETVFSVITARLPRKLHAVTFAGFELKVLGALFAHLLATTC